MIYVLLHNKTLFFSITQNFNVLNVWFGFSFILLENIFCSFGDITITTFVWRLCSAPTSFEREEGEFIVPNLLFCESLRCFFLYHPKDLLKLFASCEKKRTYFKPDSNGSNIEIWNICQWINISYTVSKVQHATNDWNISSNFIWFNVGLAFRTNYRPKFRLISEICYNIYSFHLSYSKFFLAWQSSDYLD